MATLRQLSPEEEERDQLARAQGLAPLGGPAQNMNAGRPSRAGMGSGGIGPAGGGGFVGLDRYAQANQGATAELGNKVVGSVNQAGTDARTALGKASSDFNTNVNAGEVRADQGLLGRLSSDPSSITGNANDLSRFTRMRDASYTGPSTLEETGSFGDAQTAIGKANETRELSGTDQGIGQLSDKSVTGPRTTGGRSFDTALLLQDQGLRGRLNTAREGLGTLGSEVGTASKAAQERAASAQGITNATRETTRGALTSANDAFEAALETRLQQKRDEADARTQATRQSLALAVPQNSLPTAGAAGRYYQGNDPTQGSFADRGAVAGAADPAFEQALAAYWATPQGRAALDASLQTDAGRAQFAAGMTARDVPEFIHGGSGAGALPGFNAYLPTRRNPALPDQVLGDLGVSAEQLAGISNLTPVGEMANAAAAGTNNVNPYSYVEDYETRLGDLGRFLSVRDPRAELVRENTATAADYGRAGALNQLAGPELARFILDPAQSARAGTGSTDLVDFNLAGAQDARLAALEALERRTGAHVAGNARSGGKTFLSMSPLERIQAIRGGF